MPIKNLSSVRRLPRLGKISLGVKEQKQKDGKTVEYPREVSYFVVPEKVQEVYGEKPMELKIMFPIENDEVFFSQWYKSYTFSGLQCKGDGERAMRWSDKGSLEEIPCPCEKLEKGECRQIAILQFLLPDLKGSGVWQITTSSRNSIIDINSSISYIRSICGRIRMIPLVLKREEIQTQRIENGKTKKGKHYTLKIDFADISLRQLQEAAQIAPERMLLPPPDESKDDLFFPKNGFKPEEEIKTKEPIEPKEEDTEKKEGAPDITQLRKNLLDLIAVYVNFAGNLPKNQDERINELKNSGSVDEIIQAMDYFQAKLTKLAKNKKACFNHATQTIR